ncbi:MAG: PAS domain S-box protein [Nitrospirae bacterium]|nr:PAS domain S-box protein [Nitrospirota bacterium]
MTEQVPSRIDSDFVEKIIRSQEHWQTTIDAVRDYIFVIGGDHIIRKANLSFAEKFQKHPREIIGLNVNELLCFEIPQPETLATGAESAENIISKEITIKESTFVLSVFPARYDEEMVYVYVMKDITELIDLKNKLYYTYNLASLGRLVSGVAHELNNPLTGILGYAELLGMKLQDEAVKKDLDKIYRSAERCKVIIDSLLCFSRQQATQRSLGYIHDIIDKTVELRAYWHRIQNMELIREYQENMPLAYLDTQQVQQVVLNILMNAEQAIAESGRNGRIVINVSYDKGKERIMVSISDNGIGIPKENMAKIFDPFYTTKPVNKGTGLGLSISYGIVLEHGGTIQVQSTVGEGTTFTIEFPLK